MRNILVYLLAGTRGGPTRVAILYTLDKKPLNAHQLAKLLKLDYKTVQHHLALLLEHDVITAINKGKYGALYILSEEMERNKATLREIGVTLGKDLGKS